MRGWQPGVTLNLILSMLVGGTTCKKVSYMLLVDDDKVRTWRGRECMCVWGGGGRGGGGSKKERCGCK